MKKLFWLLMPYFNKRYRPGNGIRWIIQDEKGKTPYCFCCGNFANAVGIVKMGKNAFFLPICKTHAISWMDKHTDGPWELNAPCAISIHPKLTSLITSNQNSNL